VGLAAMVRGEMAPHSDVELAFVTPWKPTSWC
jgi:[protein-PII] uridylyltransferase